MDQIHFILVPLHWLKSLSVTRMTLYIHLQDENYAIVWNCLASESILPFKGKCIKRAKTIAKRWEAGLLLNKALIPKSDFIFSNRAAQTEQGMGDRALCRDPGMLEIEFLILRAAQLHSSLHPQGSSSESCRIPLQSQPQTCCKGSSEVQERAQSTQALLPLVGFLQEWCSTWFPVDPPHQTVFAQFINQQPPQKTDAVKCKITAEHSKGSWFRVSSALCTAARSN